jgi:thiamine-monophosphate kinase
LSLAIGDDAAVFQPQRSRETILTCDWFLEGTHFLRGKHPADAVGFKCLARAVSDIAAMGGTPRCFLLSLAIPDALTGTWFDKFLRGLRRASRQFSCVLAGGDTTRRDELLIHVTVLGEVPQGRALRRDGAHPGDLLFVSGSLGGAEYGLALLRRHRGLAHPRDARLRTHLYPEPRLALGAWLAEKRLATAAMDLSDGLSSDLSRLCAASGVGAHVKSANLPAHGSLKLALHGGDDYELLFTVARSKQGQVPPSFQGVPLTAIGEITAGRKVLLVGKDAKSSTVLKPLGWDPFR